LAAAAFQAARKEYSVTLFYKLLSLAAILPALAPAADREMLNLIPPDATMVLEVNVAKIAASPIGTAIGEGIHDGMAAQAETKLKDNPQFQEGLALLGKLDLSREVQDVVIAGGTAKSAPMLMIVRSSLDLPRLQSLQTSTGQTSQYQGVPILVSAKPGNGVIAFLGNSILLIGQTADVESAIRRRSQPTVLPPALAAQVAKYSQYDFWIASTGTLTQPSAAPAPGSPAEAMAAQYLGKLAGFNGGLRFSPDFELSTDIEARTEKGAAEMGEGLRSLIGMVQSQARTAGKSGTGLEGLKYQVKGRHILLALHVPEAQVLAGLQQMRAAQAAQAAAARQAPARQPPPQRGTIRVESSEGTQVIPLDKEP
jgi:hypothetical protein